MSAGKMCCSRHEAREIDSTKKTIDKTHLDTSRSKVYFKPSVVEIHDESVAAPERSESPSLGGGSARRFG